MAVKFLRMDASGREVSPELLKEALDKAKDAGLQQIIRIQVSSRTVPSFFRLLESMAVPDHPRLRVESHPDVPVDQLWLLSSDARHFTIMGIKDHLETLQSMVPDHVAPENERNAQGQPIPNLTQPPKQDGHQQPSTLPHTTDKTPVAEPSKPSKEEPAERVPVMQDFRYQVNPNETKPFPATQTGDGKGGLQPKDKPTTL